MTLKNFTLALLLLFPLASRAQLQMAIDSLKKEILNAKHDTARVICLHELSALYRNLNPDSALLLGNQALSLAEKINYLRGEVEALSVIGINYRIIGDLPKELECAYRGLKIARENNFYNEAARCLNLIALSYSDLGEFETSIGYSKEALILNNRIPQSKTKTDWAALLFTGLSISFRSLNQIDTAFYYASKAYSLNESNRGNLFLAEGNFGRILILKGQTQKGLELIHRSLRVSRINHDHRWIAQICGYLATSFNELNQKDSAIFYSRLGLGEAKLIDYQEGILINSNLLAEIYEPLDIKEALAYQKIYRAANEKVFGLKKISQLQKAITDEIERANQVETERVTAENRLRLYLFISGGAVLLIITLLTFRIYKKENRAKRLLHDKNLEIENTLNQLKSTQSQLIQSEKMASLGELTAGIAHEIQNPLNFVNNFSEVNKELLEEMKQEAEKGNLEEVKVIAANVISNEEKINHHGKRADAIVKGMLQHSRASSGQKELTDINALCDEYLRLSYHGLRAKDKSFNAKFATDFDPALPPINVMPQDMGRVILNLINNAFYAVNERLRQPEPDKVYEPLVKVVTKKLGDKIEIRVVDNGNGIPDAIKEKIFQPFFTTKPTGQGTGLGLSLSYDIVKAHGGEIKVETTEGVGTTFIINLSIA